MWHWYKDRHIVQWTRIQSPDISPCVYGQLIFYNSAKTSQWGKNSLLTSGARTTGYPHAKE